MIGAAYDIRIEKLRGECEKRRNRIVISLICLSVLGFIMYYMGLYADINVIAWAAYVVYVIYSFKKEIQADKGIYEARVAIYEAQRLDYLERIHVGDLNGQDTTLMREKFDDMEYPVKENEVHKKFFLLFIPLAIYAVLTSYMYLNYFDNNPDVFDILVRFRQNID